MGAIYGDVGGPSPEESGLRVDLDGAIFNASELSAELGGECSDSELVLRAYKRWGNSFLERLNGTFALAIWDGPARTLLLARDRIGEKTLFYFRDGARVVFASEIKAILADKTIARRVEPLALAN